MLHAASAALLLLVPLASWVVFRVVVVAVALLAVVLETARLRSPGVRAWLNRALPVFRPREDRGPCGAMWLAVGYALASVFPVPAPEAGILVAALADPVASWVGGGGSGGTGKTWKGSAGHFVVAAAVLLVAGFSWHTWLVAAAVATTLERWPGPFDDNLVVPPAVAAAASLLM